MTPKMLRSTAAEFFGTALFVFLVAASAAAAATAGSTANLLIAFSQGLALAILVTATMGISGGHLNPAVTAGLWLAKKVNGRTAGSYVLAQITGALLGAVLAKALLPAGPVLTSSLGTPVLRGVGFWQAASIEAVLTFFLVSVVFGTAVAAEAPKVGGFAIGLAVSVAILVAGPLTGAALNPARALGPAIVSWNLTSQAVYWIGPLVGAIAAAALWKYVLLPKDPLEI